MAQRLPHKPDYLSQDDFDFILTRDDHCCALHGNCPHAQGQAYCDEQLDFDHRHPRELGGDDTFGNVRLLCRGHNRGRLVEPDEYWAERNYFDNEVVPAKLREIQRIAVWDAMADLKHLLPQTFDLRRKLLEATTLLPGATGTGKCMLAMSAFFRFNQIIGRGNPRVRHVLWLTLDTTLRDTGAIELEDDGYDIGFVTARPTVHVAKGFSDINLGPNGSDIKIAAVQGLWKVEGPGGDLRHDNASIRKALAKYDTIVFDECDWGNEQVRNIAQLGSHALQLSLTATPPIEEIAGSTDKAKEFLKRFVMITTSAVADYTRAVDLDQCLKLIADDIPIGGKHDGYASRQRGALKDHAGQMQPDLPLWRGAVTDAVISADHLETRMREADSANWYSPHIMVRMDRVADVKAMFLDLTGHLEEMYRREMIRNPGWQATMVYQGLSRDKLVPAVEYELSAKNRNGTWRHPFMLARNTKGQASADSKRILLMCQIGVRGINNWTISHIVDCTEITTLAELIQFNEGRPLRWRGRADWIDEKSPMAEFARTKVFIPTSSFAAQKRKAMQRAHEFMRNMRERMQAVGFLTWSDLIQGRRTAETRVNIDPTDRPLTEVEKYKVQACLGTAALALGDIGKLKEEMIEPALGQGKFGDVNLRVRKRMMDYARALIEDQSFRDHEVGAVDLIMEFKAQPASVMEKLHPQMSYEVDDLLRWVCSDPSYDSIRDVYVTALKLSKEQQDRNEPVDPMAKALIHSVTLRLRETQRANYRPPARVRRLHGEDGVLGEVASELIGKLRAAGQLNGGDAGRVKRAVNGAANVVFQISAEEGGPMDHPAYHMAILGRYRDKLQSLARARLIADGDLGPHLQRLAV